ncbi:MAG: hypothetical protein GY719_05670 [bacterium]|nr:hypothetical protein [bacterium]
MSRTDHLFGVFRIYLHATPYLFCFCVLGRWLLFGLSELDSEALQASSERLLFHSLHLFLGISFGLALGLALALAFDLVIGLAFAPALGLAFGLTGGLTVGLPLGLVFGLAGGLAFGLTFGLTFDFIGSITVGLTSGLAGGLGIGILGDVGAGITIGLVGGVTFAFAFGIRSGLAAGIVIGLTVWLAGVLSGGLARGPLDGFLAGLGFVLGYVVGFLRPHYIPLHMTFFWPEPRGPEYRRHPATWDDCCFLPFQGLDRLLISYAEDNRRAAEREIDRLIDDAPGQRELALRARATLLARDAAALGDLARLDDTIAGLPEGKKGFLSETRELRERVHQITSAQARLDTLDRPFLREPYTALLVKEIETFEQRIAGFHPPLASEFRRAARAWLRIATQQLAEVHRHLEREPTRQVFRAGDPVDRDREAFVPRQGVFGELERQALLATGCPGLVIYGRRRLGKSTLLRNLSGFLPPSVRIVGLTMQRARAFTSLEDLLTLLADTLESVLPPGVISKTRPTDHRGLEELLATVDSYLDCEGLRLLLGIDEYEYLDRKIGEGILSEDLLAVVRDSIQSHRRLIWTFAGSHRIDELRNSPWTSYLISARTVEMPMFSPAETRLLLTEPLRYSPLWPKGDPSRPGFEPGFWGDNGIGYIHAETGGWPHLVQLAAETVVDLVNDTGRDRADRELLEHALECAVTRGDVVLRELLERESALAGEWNYLRAFSQRQAQPPPASAEVARSLRRRLLIVEESGSWRLRVPLMTRWLRKRA